MDVIQNINIVTWVILLLYKHMYYDYYLHQLREIHLNLKAQQVFFLSFYCVCVFFSLVPLPKCQRTYK